MKDVFISYKSDDRSSAKLIAHSLEAEGFKVWWDPALQAGEDYQDIIDTNLRSALVVVVLWSPLSVKSRWVRSEATVADRQGALLPVMIRVCDRPVAFELVQTADLTRWQGDRDATEWRQFISDLHAKLAARRAQATSQHPPAPITASDLEALFWSSIKDSSDASDFESYLSRYPRGLFIDLARSRLEDRKKPPDPRWPKFVFGTAVAVSVAAAIALSTVFFNRDGANVSTSPQETRSKPVAVASDKVIEVWFAGNPHAAQQPSITVSSGILDTARTLGYSVGSRGYLATDFLPELLKAVGAGNPPDIIFIDNYIHLEGGKTALGLFKGMQSDAGLYTRLLKVSGALGDLGRGWAFLVAGSPDHDGAEALVTELSGCPTPMTTPVEALLRRVQLQAETVVRGFLQCAPDDPSILDRDSLSRRCAGKPSTARRVTVCRITAAPKLAFVETAAAVTSEHEVGRHSFVSVHRLDGDWRLLTVTEDPVSTGETAERWRELAPQFAALGEVPMSASLQTPDGVLPSPPSGERFGYFTWLPAERAAIGQVIEMNYGYDTRLFLVGPTESRLSSGQLWTVYGAWRWRVWTVGPDGALAFSQTKSFQERSP
jgi:hypothetical protein